METRQEVRDDGTPQRLMQVRNPWGYREPCLTAELTLSGNTMVSRTPTHLELIFSMAPPRNNGTLDSTCTFAVVLTVLPVS